MLALLVTTSLAATPVQLFSAPVELAPSIRSGLAAPKVKLIDASEVRRGLRALTEKDPFAGFEARPLRGWPRALTDDWDRALSYCRVLVGPHPWPDENALDAEACALIAADFLWEKYAAFMKATVVYDFDLQGELLLARSWEPGTQVARQVMVSDPTSAAELAAAVQSLREKRLPPESAPEFETIGSSEYVDPFANGNPFTKRLPPTTRCEHLATALTFATPGALAKSLSSTWAPFGTRGAPLDCQLAFRVFAERESRLGEDRMEPTGDRQRKIVTLLRCGATMVEASTTWNEHLDFMERLTRELLNRLSQKLCTITP